MGYRMCNPVACAKSNCASRVLLLCPSSDNCGNICAIYSSDVLLLVGSHIVLFLLDVDRMGTQQYSKVFFFLFHRSISVVAVQMSDTFHCVYVDVMNERAARK